MLWQHPETREIIPIGRFVRDTRGYAFSYTRAAAAVEGLRPLPGLDRLDVRYTSETIPTVFGLRVMDPERPDYADYLETIGLVPAHATPWEQIVNSGGTREGDTLQFMQVPVVVEGRATARFLVNGIRHIPERARRLRGGVVSVSAEEHEAALRRLSVGQKMLVEAEEGNPADPCASLVTTDGIPVGWVPRALSGDVRELLESGTVTATVVRVGDSTTPPHLRLVVDLDVAAPAGFQFDRDGRWEPLVAQ